MKNEKGSITLFVLVSMLFFLIIATTAYVAASSKLQGQNEEIVRIKASYEQDLSDDALHQLYNRITRTREWLQGNGTLENTYKIYTIEDLVEFSRRSNNEGFIEETTGNPRYIYVELMNDLDFKRDSSYENANRIDFGDVNEDGTVQDLKTELTTGQGFPCISATTAKAFQGTFMGNDHEIKNLWISNSIDETSKGLFGTVGNCTIQDLGITGNLTSISGAKANIGAFVGFITNDKICNVNNCYNKAFIISNDSNYSVGGFVGSGGYGTLNATNCFNEGRISGSNNAGGIVGCTFKNTHIQNCHNSGEITNTIGTQAGGLVGRDNNNQNTVTIINSYNTGKVIGKVYSGGIIGREYGIADIQSSFNRGEINCAGNSGTGGLIGKVETNANSTVKNCFNLESIIGINYLGGIIGRTQGTVDINNCYNVGTINGSSNVGMSLGMIVSEGVATVNNCYYLSTLAASDNYSIAKTDADMKLQSFVDLLNSGQTDEPWTMDTNNINNGYPILKWQLQQ